VIRDWCRVYALAGLLGGGMAMTCGCAATNDGGMRVVFYSDVQATTQWGVPEAMPIAADAINAVHPDLVIAGGDLIGGGFTANPQEAEENWAVYASLVERIEAPVKNAIGNHDLVGAARADPSDWSAPRSSFLKHTGLDRTYYAFDAGGYHFIVLDTVQVVGGDLGYEGGLDPAQREWLVSDLARVEVDKPIVLVSHMPLLSVFPLARNGWAEPAARNRVILDANKLLDLFSDRRLELVLQGHLHVFEKIEWRGTTFVTGGAVSANWWKGARLGTEEGFCVVDLNGDGVDVRYQSYEWEGRRD